LKTFKIVDLPISIKPEFGIHVVFDKSIPYLAYVTSEPSNRGAKLVHHLIAVETDEAKA
jgi:hypothetical protein